MGFKAVVIDGFLEPGYLIGWAQGVNNCEVGGFLRDFDCLSLPAICTLPLGLLKGVRRRSVGLEGSRGKQKLLISENHNICKIDESGI